MRISYASARDGASLGPIPCRRPASVGRAVPVLLVVVGLFLAFELPAYLGFDPTASRVPARLDLPLHYPLLVAHILFGSVALVTACLQIWPSLGPAHPEVHRWSGRIYLFGGVFPGGLAVLGVAPFSSTGPVSAVGNTALAVLWLATAVAGFRAARTRRYGDHRRWMLRSAALTFSIVANRVWLVVYLLLFGPFLGEDPTALGGRGGRGVGVVELGREPAWSSSGGCCGRRAGAGHRAV